MLLLVSYNKEEKDRCTIYRLTDFKMRKKKLSKSFPKNFDRVNVANIIPEFSTAVGERPLTDCCT